MDGNATTDIFLSLDERNYLADLLDVDNGENEPKGVSGKELADRLRTCPCGHEMGGYPCEVGTAGEGCGS